MERSAGEPPAASLSAACSPAVTEETDWLAANAYLVAATVVTLLSVAAVVILLWRYRVLSRKLKRAAVEELYASEGSTILDQEEDATVDDDSKHKAGRRRRSSTASDTDCSPITSTLKFLQSISDSRNVSPSLKRQAQHLQGLIRDGNLQMLDSVATSLPKSANPADLPSALKYVMGLRNDSAAAGLGRDASFLQRTTCADLRARVANAQSSSSSSLASSPSRRRLRPSSSRIRRTGSAGSGSGLEGAPADGESQPCAGSLVELTDTASVPRAGNVYDTTTEHPLAESLQSAESEPSLDGIGESFFCNVIHLREHRITEPLTYATYNVLLKSGLIKGLRLNVPKLINFLRYVEVSYNSENPYHNNWHAADVTLRCAAIINALPLPDNRNVRMHRLAAIIAAAIHDAGHIGVDNKYLMEQEDPMARMYNNQHVLEMHSLTLCLNVIMDNPSMNFLDESILKGRSSWLMFKNVVIKIVLATDMAQHFDLLGKLSLKMAGIDPLAHPEAYRKMLFDNLVLVMQIAMKGADLGHCAARWATHVFWSRCVHEEFLAQGDLERRNGLPISPMMDRNGAGPMAPANQVGFFNYVVMPLYTALANLLPDTALLKMQAEANFAHWKERMSEYEVLGDEMDDPVAGTQEDDVNNMSITRCGESLVDDLDESQRHSGPLVISMRGSRRALDVLVED